MLVRPTTSLRASRCAAFKERLAGQRNLLNGLDALQIAPGLGPRCPAAPRSRSGNRLPAARGLKPCAVPRDSPTVRWTLVALGTRLPERCPGPWGCRPPNERPALGAPRFAWTANRSLAGSPQRALSTVGGGQLLRPPGLRIPSGAGSAALRRAAARRLRRLARTCGAAFAATASCTLSPLLLSRMNQR